MLLITIDPENMKIKAVSEGLAGSLQMTHFGILGLKQNGLHFAENISKCFTVSEST